MLLQEIWDRTIIKSSQFILAKSNIEIDVDRFKVIVQDSLAVYNQSIPFSKEYTVFVNQKPYIFVKELDPVLKRVPDYIAGCIPIRGVSTVALGGGIFGSSIPQSNDELIVPLMAPYRYKKPNLFVSYTNVNYQVTAVFKHIIEKVENNQDYEIKTVDVENETDVFLFDLIQGHFLKGIGRSRKAFSISDIPITMDADALFSEGESLIEKATESIHLNKDISLSLG